MERQAYYADFQGKRSTFSQFMRQTADRLCRQYPTDPVWTTIRGLFRQYPNLDVGTRISIIKRVEELTQPLMSAGSDEQAARIDAMDSSPMQEHRSCDGSSALQPDETIVSAGSKTDVGCKSPENNCPANSCQSSQGLADPSCKPRKPGEYGNDTSRRTSSVVRHHDTGAEANGAARDRIDQIPVQHIRGVGSKAAQVFCRLGINTVEDLLRHYPRRHLDFQNRLPIRELRPGQEVTVFGAISSVGAFQPKNKNMSVFSVSISDGTGTISTMRFVGGSSNRYLVDRYKSQFPKGAQVLASGLVERDRFNNRLMLKNAEIEVLGLVSEVQTEEPEGQEQGGTCASVHAGRLVPVYPLTEGLSLRYVRNVIHNALESFHNRILDPLPPAIRSECDLCDLEFAYRNIHFPGSPQDNETARRRLVFDELFVLQVYLARRRYRFDTSQGALSFALREDGLVRRLCDTLPFALTDAQKRVFGEISRDLASAKPMHRLMQGDVGSGRR